MTNQYVKRTQRDYPLSFKLVIVEQIVKGEMTWRQAQERDGIQAVQPSSSGYANTVNSAGFPPLMQE
ncbi:hypothetical protein SM114_17615 [Erwinia pyrifoliae]|uniref:hypothetical protein n=1 Tax=Erwinia pyrifoliae TaxID=79967 RepID=UPI0009D67BFB|nr:hypothetical protein [Erwinia pyrifoliae]